MIMFSKTQTCLPSLNMHDLTYNHTNSVMLAKYSVGAFMHRSIASSCISYAYAYILKILVEQVEKNHFYKMNGDVGTAGW